TFSAAGAAVLADFFGRDDIAFTLHSETPTAADRSFSSFSQAAEESGLSRIYGGIHWSFDNEQGLATGEAVGHFVFDHNFRPLSGGRSGSDSPGGPAGLTTSGAGTAARVGGSVASGRRAGESRPPDSVPLPSAGLWALIAAAVEAETSTQN